MKKAIDFAICVCVVLFVLSTPLMAQESQSNASKRMESEMLQMFGAIPPQFKELPVHLRSAAWEMTKALESPEAVIPAKYSQLIALAVAASIPCNYCVYFHTEMAKMLGATEGEIQEAVAFAADTRFWSTVLNGAQADYESTKIEIDKMLIFIKDHSKAGKNP